MPQSPLRKQFYHKYLVATNVRKPPSKGVGLKVRNMVYANKQERQQEKQVVDFIVAKVLNSKQSTKITGVTTKATIEKYAEDLKEKEKRACEKESKKF